MKKLTLLLACLMALILNGPVFSSVQAASSVKQESIDKASAALKEIPDNKKITALGGAKISEEKLKSLKSAIKSISPSGTGIVLLDLKSGKGLSYNAGQSFYSASTMKGPFVASLASAQPSAISASNGNVTATIRWSSNEDYMSLVNRYGKNCMKQWCKKAGVRTSLATHPYTNVSAGELAKLWLQNYIFFNSSSFGKSVRKPLYQSQSVCPAQRPREKIQNPDQSRMDRRTQLLQRTIPQRDQRRRNHLWETSLSGRRPVECTL